MLDAITIFHVIKQEVRSEMEEEGVEFVSDDESESDNEASKDRGPDGQNANERSSSDSDSNNGDNQESGK